LKENRHVKYKLLADESKNATERLHLTLFFWRLLDLRSRSRGFPRVLKYSGEEGLWQAPTNSLPEVSGWDNWIANTLTKKPLPETAHFNHADVNTHTIPTGVC